MELLQADSSNKTANFSELRHEWEFIDIETDEAGSQCLCGKEIKELCYIQNKLNNNILIVGNECIKKICPSGNLADETRKIFSGIKTFNKKRTLNKTLIEYSKEKGFIDDWEYNFCLDTFRKRKLTPKQKNRRNIIYDKILKSLEQKENINDNKTV